MRNVWLASIGLMDKVKNAADVIAKTAPSLSLYDQESETYEEARRALYKKVVADYQFPPPTEHAGNA